MAVEAAGPAKAGHDLPFGLQSIHVCALVMGVMNLGAMAAIATVIALEKLVARGQFVARVVGCASIAMGAWWLASSIGVRG